MGVYLSDQNEKREMKGGSLNPYLIIFYTFIFYFDFLDFDAVSGDRVKSAVNFLTDKFQISKARFVVRKCLIASHFNLTNFFLLVLKDFFFFTLRKL